MSSSETTRCPVTDSKSQYRLLTSNKPLQLLKRSSSNRASLHVTTAFKLLLFRNGKWNRRCSEWLSGEIRTECQRKILVFCILVSKVDTGAGCSSTLISTTRSVALSKLEDAEVVEPCSQKYGHSPIDREARKAGPQVGRCRIAVRCLCSITVIILQSKLQL